jgi:hypothetical protein
MPKVDIFGRSFFIGFRGYNFLAKEMEGFLKAMQSTFCPVGFLSYSLRCGVRHPHFDEQTFFWKKGRMIVWRW